MAKSGSKTAQVAEIPPILLIEDREMERRALAHRLSGQGFTVLEFESGTAAIRAVEESGRAGVVLTDNKMPDDAMDGVDAALTIQELDPTASIVFRSNSVGDPDFRARATDAGLRVDGWFEKLPFSAETEALIERLHLEIEKVQIRRFLLETETTRGIEPHLALEILALWDPRAREVFSELQRELTPSDGALNLEEEIDRIYEEFAELVAKPAEDATAQTAIDLKRRQLRALQEQEAAIARRRAESRMSLRPGQGHEALARAARLLAE